MIVYLMQFLPQMSKQLVAIRSSKWGVEKIQTVTFGHNRWDITCFTHRSPRHGCMWDTPRIPGRPIKDRGRVHGTGGGSPLDRVHAL